MAKKYRVKAGDNLWKIAKELYGDGRAMKRLMYLNGLNSTTIRPGMTLKLPTIVEGRNDRFRITNAEANQYGLASQQQIASGQAGAGAGTNQPSNPFQVSANTRPTSNEIGIGAPGGAVERQQIISQNMPIGDDMMKGVSMDPRRKDPRRRARGPQEESKGGSGVYREGTSQAVINQAKAGLTPDEVAQYTGTGAMGSASWRRNQASGFSWGEQAPTLGQFGAPQPGKPSTMRPEGMVNLAGSQQGQNYMGGVLQQIGQTLSDIRWPWEQPEPTGMVRSAFEGTPRDNGVGDFEQELISKGVISGTFSDTAIKQWGKFDSKYTVEAYGGYFTELWSKGIPLERIPAPAVVSQHFPYPIEVMRQMGYGLSEDGKVYEYNPPTDEDIIPGGDEVTFNPFTGRTSGSGSGFGSTGGYGGTGGFGRPSGPGAGNSVNNVLRATGSWKGMNFG